jgi:2-polyprenyl-6-methoxyphenol hydroxylase-like FAD-dependent oxidoreductase
MQNTSLLISGAGIAGATLAVLAARQGFDVTVVERAAGQRSSGSPVDVHGAAYAVAERVGVIDQLRDHATHTTELTIVNSAGQPTARMAINSGRDPHHIEIARTDLSATLARAGVGEYELIWSDYIREIRDVGHSVEVDFASGASRKFDLVVGADGTHSGVRALTMSHEADSLRFLGLYVATVQLDEEAQSLSRVLMHNDPGASLTVHPTTGVPTAAFIFRSEARLDYRDHVGQLNLLRSIYEPAGWRAAELLGAYARSDDTYFDAVTKVSLKRWSRGRIALVGDAASSLSLFGDGSSSAMVGASTLADVLAAADRRDRNWAAAFTRYEQTHRRFVTPKHRGFQLGSHLLVPATRGGIIARNAALRLTGGRPSPLLQESASK